jgi:hypothetical protein
MLKKLILFIALCLGSYRINAQIRPTESLNLKVIKQYLVATERSLNYLLHSKDTLKDFTIFKTPEIKIPNFTVAEKVYEILKPTITNKLFFIQAHQVFKEINIFNLDTASVNVLEITNETKTFRISLNVEFIGLYISDSKKQKINESQEWTCSYNPKTLNFQIESIKSLRPILNLKPIQISEVEKLKNELQSCIIQMMWPENSVTQKEQAFKNWEKLGGPDSIFVMKQNNTAEKILLQTWKNQFFTSEIINNVLISGMDIEQVSTPSINRDKSYISKIIVWKGVFFNDNSPKWYESKQELYRTVNPKQTNILVVKAVSIKF